MARPTAKQLRNQRNARIEARRRARAGIFAEEGMEDDMPMGDDMPGDLPEEDLEGFSLSEDDEDMDDEGGGDEMPLMDDEGGDEMPPMEEEGPDDEALESFANDFFAGSEDVDEDMDDMPPMDDDEGGDEMPPMEEDDLEGFSLSEDDEDMDDEGGGDEMPLMDDEGGGDEEMDLNLEDDGDGDMDLEMDEEDEGEGMFASSAFGYNPLYQKPSSIGPGPSGGYHYYGPMPDAGTSYGYFADAGTNIGIIAPLRIRAGKYKPVFSPATGKKMKLVARVGTDGLATVLAAASDMTKLPNGHMTSVRHIMSVKGDIFDPMSGRDLAAVLAHSVTAEDRSASEGPVEPTVPGEAPEDIEDNSPEATKGEDGFYAQTPAASTKASKRVRTMVLNPKVSSELASSDVHMTLFGEDGDKPFWNIDIKGVPTASVHLSDQDKPDEIRATFCSPEYYKGVTESIAQLGAKEVLTSIKARFWANKVNESKFAKQVRANVESQTQQKNRGMVKNLSRELMSRIAIVCAGFDKNFYRDTGNPLKEAMWSEMKRYGIHNPAPIIEAAFREGATPYFEAVLTKAQEYMEFEPKALAQVKQAIASADVLTPGDGTIGSEIPEATDTPADAQTLSERLATSSVSIQGMPIHVGDPVGDHKQQLKRELRLGGAGPGRNHRY